MFQICVLDQNVQENELVLHSWNFSLNAIIRNIKIHNTLDITEILKSMKSNKRIWKKNLKIFIQVFSIIFQSLMGPNKWRCDICNGTIQGWVCPTITQIYTHNYQHPILHQSLWPHIIG
jgi:rubrerythrin